MKPSDRIKQMCRELCAEMGNTSPTVVDLMDVLAPCIMKYLDEQQVENEKRMVWLANKAQSDAQMNMSGMGGR